MNSLVDEIFGDRKPERYERFRGDYPVRVRGLVNSFGDQTIHNDTCGRFQLEQGWVEFNSIHRASEFKNIIHE